MANAEAFGIASEIEGELFEKAVESLALSDFTPKLAQIILGLSATSASQWFIPPLQDLLYLDKSLWLPEACDERINVPGTVTEFNWTYRLPCSLEELAGRKDLIVKIKAVAAR